MKSPNPTNETDVYICIRTYYYEELIWDDKLYKGFTLGRLMCQETAKTVDKSNRTSSSQFHQWMTRLEQNSLVKENSKTSSRFHQSHG